MARNFLFRITIFSKNAFLCFYRITQAVNKVNLRIAAFFFFLGGLLVFGITDLRRQSTLSHLPHGYSRSGDPLSGRFRKTGAWAFTFTSLPHSWSELQAYNMIPFHGIRSSFGTGLIFSFLGCFAVATKKLYLSRWEEKSLVLDRGESSVKDAVSDFRRCFKTN